MHYRTFYRCSLVLPLLLSGLVTLTYHGFGYRPGSQTTRGLTQLGLMTFLYGGLPYAALLIGAWLWMSGRSESSIRRMATRAPLLMVMAFVAFAALLGLSSGEVEAFLALSALGAVYSLAIGYLFVGLTFLVRYAVGRAGLVMSEPR